MKIKRYERNFVCVTKSQILNPDRYQLFNIQRYYKKERKKNVIDKSSVQKIIFLGYVYEVVTMSKISLKFSQIECSYQINTNTSYRKIYFQMFNLKEI